MVGMLTTGARLEPLLLFDRWVGWGTDATRLEGGADRLVVLHIICMYVFFVTLKRGTQ